MRKLLYIWLFGWAIFGFPWASFTLRPRLSRASWIPFRRTRRRDVILNFLYYVPLGGIGILYGWSVPFTAGVAAALSCTTEFVQLFSSERFPASSDLLLNTAGAIVGIALTTIVFARTRA